MKEELEFNPPVSEGSREVANLTWIKNPHTPVYGVKEFVCLLQILTQIIHLYLIDAYSCNIYINYIKTL